MTTTCQIKMTGKSSTSKTPIINKFGILLQDKDTQLNAVTKTANQTKQPKRVWIPPITITSEVREYQTFITRIKNVLNHDRFSVKFNINNTKIFTHTNDDYDKLILNLKSQNTQFFTLTKHKNKVKKIVLKAPPSWEVDQIKNNITDTGNKVIDIKSLKGKQNLGRSFLVTVPQEQKINEIKTIKIMDHCKVQWEPYFKKRNYTQCYRCQRFGHSSNNCNLTPRCLKCPGFHLYTECTLQKTNTSKPYCHNCNQDHSANYTKCPSLIAYLEKRNSINQTNTRTTQNTNNTRPSLNTQKTNFPLLKTTQNNRFNDNTLNDQQFNQQSYRDALLNPPSTSKDNEDYTEIIKLIKVIKSLKNEINQASDQMEKIAILLKYINHF